MGHHLAAPLGAGQAPYEVPDATAAPVRNVKRRGWGWLPEYVTRGWSTRPGWYACFHVLVAATPEGAITGYGIGPATAKDQPLAEDFFAARATADPRLPTVGRPANAPSAPDSGFIGADRHEHWHDDFGAQVSCPPYRSATKNWPPTLRRWHSGRRQIVESVNDRQPFTFRFDRERPHQLGGFRTRLAARVARHNCCCWLNRLLGW